MTRAAISSMPPPGTWHAPNVQITDFKNAVPKIHIIIWKATETANDGPDLMYVTQETQFSRKHGMTGVRESTFWPTLRQHCKRDGAAESAASASCSELAKFSANCELLFSSQNQFFFQFK